MKERTAQWYVNHKLKPPKDFFDSCYRKIHTFRWKNKQKTILASDRKGCYVIEKRLTKRTNLTFFDKFYSFAIIMVTAKRIEIQTYCFWSKIEDGKQIIETELTNFEHFSRDRHVKVTTHGGGYIFGLSKMTDYGGPYTHTMFYNNNWKERIKKISELKYIDYQDKPIEAYDISHFYKYRSEIEFLQKINARVLAHEVMYPTVAYTGWETRKNVDMRTITPKWLKENKSFFKNSDRSFMEYELENRIKNRGGKVVPGVEQYIDYRDIKKIPSCVGLISFQNWVIKNKIDMKFYYDYLGVLKDLNIKVDSKNLAIPKDLTKAHDNAVKLLNQMEREVEDREYKKRLKSILKLEKEVENYAFLVPKELNDLITEGKTLHHCVGGSGYIENHKKGKTTIIFIREKEYAEKSLYTMEYKSGRIIQIRGKHNQNPPEEIKHAAEEWLKAI